MTKSHNHVPHTYYLPPVSLEGRTEIRAFRADDTHIREFGIPIDYRRCRSIYSVNALHGREVRFIAHVYNT